MAKHTIGFHEIVSSEPGSGNQVQNSKLLEISSLKKNSEIITGFSPPIKLLNCDLGLCSCYSCAGNIDQCVVCETNVHYTFKGPIY